MVRVDVGEEVRTVNARGGRVRMESGDLAMGRSGLVEITVGSVRVCVYESRVGLIPWRGESVYSEAWWVAKREPGP